jgi:L-methionine (R)-S-oxide reductase
VRCGLCRIAPVVYLWPQSHSQVNKEEQYKLSLQQIEAITQNESNRIANMANVVAVLKQNLGYFWIGFYVVDGDELVLGPFQGTPACVRITRGKGVCGSTWENKETIIVEDVHLYPNHISCDANSKSEIVVPVFDKSGKVSMVLDLDHDEFAAFDKTDQTYLEQLAKYLQTIL